MADIYIRDQDRTALYRFGGGAMLFIDSDVYDNPKPYYMYIRQDGETHMLGVYATKEKCLNVIDEIEKMCMSYSNGAVVYHMPPYFEPAEETPAEETPIEELELSVRSYNCLKRAGLHTVGDVTMLTDAQLREIKFLGKKSCDEIIARLSQLGMPLRDE